ncbi:fumarylacetoacetate hydrolase family protein [Pseudonocardia broussonetiae]|uniref:Fumarylacetoacetate hydrolase family protein n=1 Tax=Pseudonocardia broussonetiae TaxID=2736640 RepID=A0A6M6JT64_9PSEU|nr:fumarylacetoacetate hydrolase family protein [Pseudonocardia broussonetiae]QJY49401.1 fumarylacetoacetate hydrolase family protein [Pseudonocardia broussonetiae]
MHLVSHRGTDGVRPGVLDGPDVVDLPGVGSVLDLLRLGPAGTGLAREAVHRSRATGEHRLPAAAVSLAAPLPRPNSIRDFMLVEEHVLNCFGSVPDEWYRLPAHWKGNPDTVIGPDDEVPWPYYTDRLDFELEVAVVLGREAHRVGPDEARECIAGYTIMNDWSARDIQLREMTVQLGPAFGKDFATSMGPALVTPDEFDVGDARMSARVNGETWSEGSLGSMVFGFVDVIVALSAEQRLQPGDVLAGGTIGRGCGFELDRWIRPGDVVELEVSGLGVLRNVVGKKNDPPPYGPDLSDRASEEDRA